MSRKGQKHTEEAKKKISLAISGYLNPMWGKTHSKETKKKISLANLGRSSNSGSFKSGPRPELRKRVTKTCVMCQKEFEIKFSHASFARSCSKVCGYKDRASRQVGRKLHSEEFKRRLSERNNRGGVTVVNKLIRSSETYAAWRRHVFQRDNYTCQDCGQWGGKLQADHELPFSLFPGIRLEILNGRTLCVECHRKLPRTRGQLEKLHMFI